VHINPTLLDSTTGTPLLRPSAKPYSDVGKPKECGMKICQDDDGPLKKQCFSRRPKTLEKD
jgi:hypothetical protein